MTWSFVLLVNISVELVVQIDQVVVEIVIQIVVIVVIFIIIVEVVLIVIEVVIVVVVIVFVVKPELIQVIVVIIVEIVIVDDFVLGIVTVSRTRRSVATTYRVPHPRVAFLREFLSRRLERVQHTITYLRVREAPVRVLPRGTASFDRSR